MFRTLHCTLDPYVSLLHLFVSPNRQKKMWPCHVSALMLLHNSHNIINANISFLYFHVIIVCILISYGLSLILVCVAITLLISFGGVVGQQQSKH